HARNADDEATAAIRRANHARGVLHCFSSGEALLHAALGSDWYVSFAGLITFRKWDQADLLRAVPLDRLLLETDSPYLAPAPFRGRTNEPAYIPLTAMKAAEIRGEELERMASA